MNNLNKDVVKLAQSITGLWLIDAHNIQKLLDEQLKLKDKAYTKQTKREQELMALVEMCEKALGLFSDVVCDLSELSQNEYDAQQACFKALAAIQKAKGV